MPIRVTQRRERQLGYVCDLVYRTLGIPLVSDTIPLKGVGGGVLCKLFCVVVADTARGSVLVVYTFSLVGLYTLVS